MNMLDLLSHMMMVMMVMTTKQLPLQQTRQLLTGMQQRVAIEETMPFMQGLLQVHIIVCLFDIIFFRKRKLKKNGVV